jgi:hypothetical protein
MEDSIMAKISEVLGSISKTNLVFVQSSTNNSSKSISAPGADVWFDLPDVTITIPEDGVYIVTTNVRIWQHTTTDNKWLSCRVLNNGNAVEDLHWTVFNPGTLNFGFNMGSSKSTIIKMYKDDVITIQGFIRSNQSGDVFYSDANGGTSISAYKIGE